MLPAPIDAVNLGAARPSLLVVGLLFFFSLIAPSAIWPAIGVRGFMLLGALLWVLLIYLLLSRRRIRLGAVIGAAALFITAAVPSMYWGELRLLLYPLFFISSMLLVSIASKVELDAFVDVSSSFVLALLVGAVFAFGLATLDLPPLSSFQNTDGRDNYIFYTTLSNTVEVGFIRPSGIYDEPGAFSFFICSVAFLRHALGKPRTMTFTLLLLGLVTFSLTHMLFLFVYLLASATRVRHLLSFMIGLALFVGSILLAGGFDMIANQVLSRLAITDDGTLAGDTRSMLLFNALFVLASEEHAALMGVDSSCTLDAPTCIDRVGAVGENLLSPLVSQGIFLSWPYYFFLIASLIALFEGRRGLMFFAVGLLFVQRPYLMNLGYSVLGAVAFIVHLQGRPTVRLPRKATSRLAH